MENPRNWIATIVIAASIGALFGFGAGFGASYMHPGPEGRTGPQGASGARGLAGPQGPAGIQGPAATSGQLGVCYSYVWTTEYGTTLIESIDIESPHRNQDGTVSCLNGTYVPVTPQGG